MNRGKLIVIEGTDCSGKETQSKLLIERLKKEGIKIARRSFPMYDTPTGKIVGADLLGKPAMGESVFEESFLEINPKVRALYYAADRLYNIEPIKEMLNSGINVILDRYVTSNMAYQAAEFETKEEKIEMMKWSAKLEYELLELPEPDLVIFLYMPYQYTIELLNKRKNLPDKNEKDEKLLRNSEITYSLMSEKYNFEVVHCIKDDKIRSVESINNDIYNIIKNKI